MGVAQSAALAEPNFDSVCHIHPVDNVLPSPSVILPLFALGLHIQDADALSERTTCKDNRLLGEFELNGIPPMPRGQAELLTTFEVDANGILKVTAQEKSSGRKANITISNSVGKLSADEIDAMIKDAEQFKAADRDYTARHEAKSDLESYLHTVEQQISSPELASKIKRGAKASIEAEIAKALELLEQEDATTEQYKKSSLLLKRGMQKALSGGR